MEIPTGVIKELAALAGKKVNKTDWFAEKSGLNSLKIDANATLKACGKVVTENPLIQSHMKEEEYIDLIKKDPIQGLEVYWKEILQRVRYVLNVSVLRSQKWLEGIFLGVHYENLFVFTSSYRGFIEAVADSLDALKVANQRLQTNKENIDHLLSGKTMVLWDGEDAKNYLDPTLEAALIHFSHARDTWREDVEPPNSHKKKKFGEYLKSIDVEYRERVRESWFELCQLTHPSASSTTAYVLPDVKVGSGNDTWVVGVPRDFLEIAFFTLKHGNILANLCNELLSQLFICQHLLRELPYREVHEPEFGVFLNKNA